MLIGPKNTSDTSATVVRPAVPVNDRRINSEAMLLGFLAENDLPFTMTPKLIQFSQQLAKDPKALNELKMDRCTASYKMTYGLASFFTEELIEELRSTFFCLNLDESTNSNQEKVVAVLVSYFSSEKKEISVRHLESFTVIKADAESIFLKIEELFEKHQLPWNNLISVLMDSCSTMRGKKSGLETRLREKAPHLLDIDGDSVHHAHNVAKSFATPFNYYLEGLFNSIHTDFLYSSDLRDELERICIILNIKFTRPERFTSHRFICAHKLAVDTDRLFDAYTVLYYSFLDKKEKLNLRKLVDFIFTKHEVSEEGKSEMEKSIQKIAKKSMTKDGKERKERIKGKLFDERRKTIMLLSIYKSVLETLKEYAVLFQAKEPMIHILHDKQIQLLCEFLGYFVKPQLLPNTGKELKKIELKEPMLMPKTDIFMGAEAYKIVSRKGTKDSLVNEITSNLQVAYMKSGKALINKMPVDNKLLEGLSALDPLARGHSITVKLLKRLPEQMSNILQPEEESDYMKEVHRFQYDPTLPDYKETTRIDSWWAAQQNSYPKLSKIALAGLTCFHGPMVECVFNLMGDVMDQKSSSLSIKSLNSIQTVKSTLKAKNTTSITYFDREDVVYTPIRPGLVNCMIRAGKERNRALMRKRIEKEERNKELKIKDKRVVTKRLAHEMSAERVMRARVEHSAKVMKIDYN